LNDSETVDYVSLSLNASGSSSLTETEVVCGTLFTLGVILSSRRWGPDTPPCRLNRRCTN